jgi:hypothetical protein
MIIAQIANEATHTFIETGIGLGSAIDPVGASCGHLLVALRHLLCGDATARRNQITDRIASY